MPDGADSMMDLHWGGGSPTILTSDDIIGLATHVSECFKTSPSTEFAVEIDPRGIDENKIDALARAGTMRAINRVQSFGETHNVISGLRRAGVARINIDLIYGLPYQTTASAAATVDQVLKLEPNRIALFGYAHVPWMKRHQSMIDEEILPNVQARFEQSQLMAELLCDAGYERIGMDHFALPDDPLTMAKQEGRLRRNFQGYTDDPADVLLGFGASAIGKLKQGYVHNVTPTGEYQRLIGERGFAVVDGYRLQPDDELRAHVIERLICESAFSSNAIRDRFGESADCIFEIADNYAKHDRDGLVEWDQDTFRITPRGQPFVRTICANFDGFLNTGGARHSVAV